MIIPKVSVIIVSYNGQKLLEKCLDSLSNITYDNFEIILVDNNSSDNTIQFVSKHFPSIIIIKLNSNKGFAEPNNIAAKIAKGDYLLFLNNDTVVTPNFISEMIKAIQSDQTIGMCQSLLLKPNGSIDSSGVFIDKLGVVYNSKTKINKIREISSARGASMLIQKNIFDKLKGFDEKFFASFEDVDLGWRTWIIGYRVILVPTSVVYHSAGTTMKKMKSEIAFHGFKNQLSIKITNFEMILSVEKMILFFITYGKRELKIWLDYTFRHATKLSPTKYEDTIATKPNVWIILKSVWWLVKNQKYLIKKQRFVNSMRVFSTKELENRNIICNEKF